MGCNQSKAAATKPSQAPAAPAPAKQQVEVAAIAEVVVVAPKHVDAAPAAPEPAAPEPIVAEAVETATPAPAAPAVEEQTPVAETPIAVPETPVVVDVEVAAAPVEASPLVAETPADVHHVVAATPVTPVKKANKKKHAAAPAAPVVTSPKVEAFARSTAAPAAFAAFAASPDQENESPKRSALKPARTSGRLGFGQSAKINTVAAAAPANEKAVHFAAEPAKQQHPTKLASVMSKMKGKGARKSLNGSNVREEVLLAQISAFERLLTDASTLHRQLDSR